MIAVFGAEGFVLWEEDACEGVTAAKRVRVFIHIQILIIAMFLIFDATD